MDTAKCHRCHVILPNDRFKIKRCGNMQKHCIECNTQTLISRTLAYKEKNHKCPSCDYKCGTNGNLSKHINAVHLQLKGYKCPDCDYECVNSSKLQRHIDNIHLKLRDHHCPTCDSTFATIESLRSHVNGVHLKLKNHECPNCDFKSSSRANLQKHINTIHLKLRDYKCLDCESAFATIENLHSHVTMVHSKLKDYHCLECDSKFKTKGHLERHVKAIHLLEKKFQCPDCDYKCVENHTLQNHIKRFCTGELHCSSGEYKIIQLLEQLGLVQNVDFLHDAAFWNVRDKNLLRFDFILNHTSKNPIVIEFDGEAHYRSVRFGGMSREKAEEQFISSQRRDQIKNAHCLANNIPLLRIHFKDIDAIDDIVTAFLAAHAPPLEEIA